MPSPIARARALFVTPEAEARAPAAYLPGAEGPARRVPGGIFRIRTAEDLAEIPFRDGLAAIEMPAELLEEIRFRNDRREPDRRQRALEASIRSKGYSPVDPIIVSVAADGQWDVIDGGHRLTAIRRIAREFWTNLFGPRIRSVYLVLFQNTAGPDAETETETGQEQGSPTAGA